VTDQSSAASNSCSITPSRSHDTVPPSEPPAVPPVSANPPPVATPATPAEPAPTPSAPTVSGPGVPGSPSRSENPGVSLPVPNQNSAVVASLPLRPAEVAPGPGTQTNESPQDASTAQANGGGPSTHHDTSVAALPIPIDEMSVRAPAGTPDQERSEAPPSTAAQSALVETPPAPRFVVALAAVGADGSSARNPGNLVPEPQAPARSVGRDATETTVPRGDVIAEPAYSPRAAVLLAERVPVDLAAVEAALQQFLDQLRVPGAGPQAASSWLEISTWLVAAGVVAYEILRRRQASVRFAADDLWARDGEIA
jgi:hypothetical protein